MDERWHQVKKVLVVRLDNLGDVLLCTPAIRAIRETKPDVRITLLASRVGAQVGELNPDIDEVIVYEAPWMDVWQRMPQDSSREEEMIRRLRSESFDGAIIFTSFRQSSLPAAYLCYLADIPLRLGISIDGSGSLLTTRHRVADEPVRHEVLRALDLAAQEGFQAADDSLVLHVSKELLDVVGQRLMRDGVDLRRPITIIHPGCTMPARTYPWERFVNVADLMVERLSCQVIFTGTTEESDLVQRVRSRMRNKSLSWASSASFGEFAALIAMADVLVTNNTGPQHVASAVHTPVVVLFALTNPPEQWGPWKVAHRLLYREVPCRLCYSRVCPTDHACLTGVSPDEVVDAVGALLGGKVPR